MKIEELMAEDYASIFGIGYHHILREDEGLVVEYNNELYAIFKRMEDGKSVIYINEVSDHDITEIEGDDKLEGGRRIWLHDKLKEN